MRRNLIERCILKIALLIPIAVAASLSSPSPPIIVPPIQSVIITGGVHGNEYTGVWCVKALERKFQSTGFQDKYASLDLSTLIGNPEAHSANKRFMDTDLNRLFTLEALTSAATSMEGHRAKEIDQLVGPKFGASKPTSRDCIIDLHSTTANMGLTLIFPEGDVLMARACAYAMHKCNTSASANTKITRILFESRSSRQEDPFLISCAPHGFTIEVGPVPQGVLRHDAVLSTDEALEAALEYLHMHNTQPENALETLNECYKDGVVPCFFYEDKIPVCYKACLGIENSFCLICRFFLPTKCGHISL